jgi:hypothetical protein
LAGISAYPELYALIGSNVPDYRGLFLRGHGSQAHAQNNGSSVGVTSTTHSSGALGSIQGDATREISGAASSSEANHHGYFGEYSGAFVNVHGYAKANAEGENVWIWGRGVGLYTSRVVPTANENRPVNTAVRYLIRALP